MKTAPANRIDLVSLLLVGFASCAGPVREDERVGASFDAPSMQREDLRSAPVEASVSTAPSLPRMPLSLEAALARAEQANPDLEAAAARMDAARARIDQVRSRLFPSLDLGLSLSSTNHPVYAFMGDLSAREFSFAGDFNDPDRTDHATASLSLTQVLWDGGRRSSDREVSELALRARKHEREALRQRLLFGVTSTYLAVHEAEASVRVAEDAMAWASAELAAGRVRHEEGAALRSEVLSLEVRQAEAEEARLRASHAREALLEELRSLLALPADAALELENAAQRPQLEVPAGDALELAGRKRPDLVAAQVSVERARQALKGSRKQRNPSLVFVATGTLDDDDYALDGTADAYLAAISLGWPLYQGGRVRSQQKEAEATLREANARLQGLQSRVTLEVRNGLLRLEDARRRREVAARALEDAEQALALVSVEREEGAATVTRVLEAESARSAARARLVHAEHDELRAIVELRTAVGLDPLADPDAGGKAP